MHAHRHRLISHICEHTETTHACMQALGMHIAHPQGQMYITYMHMGTHSSNMQSHIAYAKTQIQNRDTNMSCAHVLHTKAHHLSKQHEWTHSLDEITRTPYPLQPHTTYTNTHGHKRCISVVYFMYLFLAGFTLRQAFPKIYSITFQSFQQPPRQALFHAQCIGEKTEAKGRGFYGA